MAQRLPNVANTLDSYSCSILCDGVADWDDTGKALYRSKRDVEAQPLPKIYQGTANSQVAAWTMFALDLSRGESIYKNNSEVRPNSRSCKFFIRYV